MKIKIPAFKGFAGGGTKGALSISNIQDLRLDFAGLVPGKLSGRVGNFSLTGLEIDLDQLAIPPSGPAAPIEYDDTGS